MQRGLGSFEGQEVRGSGPTHTHTHTHTHTQHRPVLTHPLRQRGKKGGEREVETARRTWKILDGAPRSGRGGERGRGGGSKQDTHKHTLMHTYTPAVTHRIEAEFNNDLELSERGRSSKGGREGVG